MPRIPGLLERIQQPLYDDASGTSTVHQNGTAQATYFQVPTGAGVSWNSANTKNLNDTNMDQGGSLPYPKNFEIHAIRLVNQYGSSVLNLSRIYDQSWFRLFIGTKDYLVVNSFMLTAGVGLHGVAAGNTAVTSVVNGRSDQRGIYVLAEPIDLIPQQNFRCELNFPIPFGTGPVAPLTAAVNIWCYMDGFLKREVH